MCIKGKCGNKFIVCIYFILTSFIFYTSLNVLTILKNEEDQSCEMETLRRLLRGPLSPFDERLIKEVALNFLVPPSRKNYNLKLHKTGHSAKVYNDNYKSLKSWKFLSTEIRILFPPEITSKGFYVEAGAFDGEFMSNSLYLELELGWNGLLIEPDNELFQALLAKNRKAWSSHCCLSSKPFPHETVLKKILSSDNKSPVQILTRIHNAITESPSFEVRSLFGLPVYETVQCLPLHTLLLALNQTHVDLLSLDIEDIEVEVLKDFAWDKITVDVWLVEHRHSADPLGNDGIDNDFIKWFDSKGYLLYKVAPYELDYIFIKRDSVYFKANRHRLFL